MAQYNEQEPVGVLPVIAWAVVETCEYHNTGTRSHALGSEVEGTREQRVLAMIAWDFGDLVPAALDPGFMGLATSVEEGESIYRTDALERMKRGPAPQTGEDAGVGL